MTDYPDIFKGIYWGGAKGADYSIIENRNKFVELFHIKKRSSASLAYIHLANLGLDHLEIYKNDKGLVFVVFSTYKLKYSNDFTTYLGFIPYFNLYSNNSDTYLAIFENFKELSKKIALWRDKKCECLEN